MAWANCPSNATEKELGICWAEDTISRWLIMRTGTKLNDSGPYRNASVTYNNDLAPFQGASAGWTVPRVETLG
jgi:hypothetical protein